MAVTSHSQPPLEHGIEQAILTAVREIRFGSLEIVIHDSRIVQIERKEKLRFDAVRT